MPYNILISLPGIQIIKAKPPGARPEEDKRMVVNIIVICVLIVLLWLHILHRENLLILAMNSDSRMMNLFSSYLFVYVGVLGIILHKWKTVGHDGYVKFRVLPACPPEIRRALSQAFQKDSGEITVRYTPRGEVKKGAMR